MQSSKNNTTLSTCKTLELIEEIRKRPVLYDRNHIHFYDYHKKEHFWNWLSRKFNIKAKQRWGSLRDKYVRLKREREYNSESKIVEKWDFYEPLSFLNNYCKHRKKSSTFSKSESSLPSDLAKFEFAIVSSNDDQISMEESQKIRDNYFDIEEIEAISNHSEFPDSRRSDNNATADDYANENLTDNDTENMLFMRMIGIKLQLLPNRHKNKIQIEILQLVNEELDKYDC